MFKCRDFVFGDTNYDSYAAVIIAVSLYVMVVLVVKDLSSEKL